MEIKFIHRVSKGTRFNQIYIPKEMLNDFQSGDLVEVVLLEKKNPVFFSPRLKKLTEFKENLIKNIFLELKKYKEIHQIFVIGSFLTQKQDFNDLDILLISNKDLEKEVYDSLIDIFELKFHIISISPDKFKELQKYCPLTRSMLYYFASNKEFNIIKDTQINKDHIRFLLMMPEDILKLDINSRSYFDSIRRLIAIQRFFDNLSLDPLSINEEIKKLVSEDLFKDIKQNQNISPESIKSLKKIIKSKLDHINKKLI